MLGQDHLEVAKLTVSAGGLALSMVAAAAAYLSFRRSEKWKKAEFLATEMKAFFADERIKIALSLIDWGTRRIRLDLAAADSSPGVVVTREMQVSALRPHILLNIAELEFVMDGESADAKKSFSPDEARIRDCYDAFLDGLERVANYAKTNLIDVSALRPYLAYWISEIHAPTKSRADAAYCAALLTYMKFYSFNGALWLFSEFGCPIDTSSSAYQGFLKQMADQSLASALAGTVDPAYSKTTSSG
jgi:hypothetical protein